jgi:cell division protein FtsL
MSTDLTLLIVVAFLWISWKNWGLAEEVEEANETIDAQNSLIACMAEELNKLGSPNVKQTTTPTYNINYE